MSDQVGNTEDRFSHNTAQMFASSTVVSIKQVFSCHVSYETRSEKTGLRDFRPGPTQTGLYNYTLGISDLGIRGIVLSV